MASCNQLKCRGYMRRSSLTQNNQYFVIVNQCIFVSLLLVVASQITFYYSYFHGYSQFGVGNVDKIVVLDGLQDQISIFL